MQMTAAFEICLQMRALMAVGGWPQAPCQKAGAAVASMPPSPENDAAAKTRMILRMPFPRMRCPIRLVVSAGFRAWAC
jgi:hypothetical protein